VLKGGGTRGRSLGELQSEIELGGNLEGRRETQSRVRVFSKENERANKTTYEGTLQKKKGMEINAKKRLGVP